MIKDSTAVPTTMVSTQTRNTASWWRSRSVPIPFTATALLLGTWLIAGAYVDAWAHHHFTFETFFTPWHALLYSAAAANTFFYCTWWVSHRRTVPAGYELSLVGCLLFSASGVGDLAWHSQFGIERDFAAILSPTHLGLMLSVGLIVTGPLRSAWRATASRLSWSAAWSAALLLGLVNFFMQDLHPFTAQWSNPDSAARSPLRLAEMLGTDNLVLASSALIGLLLLLLLRFRLRPGQVLLVTAVPATAVVLSYQPDPVIVLALLGGLFGEGWYALLRPSAMRPLQFRLFAVCFSLLLWGFYVWALAASDGTWWPIHSEFGVVAVTVIAAWLLTYAAIPPVGTRYTDRSIDHGGLT